MAQSDEVRFMRRAFVLAERGLNNTASNPRVGCVLVKDNEIVGEGFHEAYGSEHAEVVALRNARGKAKGSMMYVTLEPCCFKGKTQACTHEIINAGVKVVVAACKDPNPKVFGKGFEELKKNGITVRIIDMEKDCFELNPGFFKRMKSNLPWVRVKIAMSLDGYIALGSGESKWITGKIAREDGHRWRARSCCLLTGSRTVVNDDPEFTARVSGEDVLQPEKVIIDPRLIVSKKAKIFASGKVILATLLKNDKLITEKVMDYRQKGVHVIELKPKSSQSTQFYFKHLLGALSKRGFNEILVEGGPSLVSSLMTENVVDEFLIYKSSKILGAGVSFVQLNTAKEALTNERQWVFKSVNRVGEDVFMSLRKKNNSFYGLANV